MIDEAAIELRYRALYAVLDERGRRRFAAAEASAAGRGGVALVARITGIARSTIGRGLAELRDAASGDVADSDEAGRLFQSEVGHAFQLDRGHPADLIPAG